MEDREHRLGVVPWITLLVASIMMLFITNSMLHYATNTSGETPVDLAGSILPYALFVMMLCYYLLRLDTRKMRLHRVEKRGHRIFMSFFLLISVIIIFIVPFVVVYLLLKMAGSNPVSTGSPNSVVLNGTGQSNQVGSPSFSPLSLSFSPWLLLSAISVVFALVMLVAVTSLGRRNRIIEETESVGEVGAKSISLSANRYIDDDCRKAIIACYAQSREHMVNQGVPLTEAMTPREFETNVLQLLRVAGKDFTSLTNLFEEARFSVHPMGHSEEAKAKNHYEKLSRISSNEDDKN